jgi:DNA-binding Xre family transcriptional regulator
MKIITLSSNNHRHAFDVGTERGSFTFPYAKADPVPRAADPLADLFIDDELGREGFTYLLRSGAEGSVHVDQVLEYNRDPHYLRHMLLYRLSVEAVALVVESRLTKRELSRRLGTSTAQLNRLLDPTNTRKSVDQLVSLLQVLDCDVDLVVRGRRGAWRVVRTGFDV